MMIPIPTPEEFYRGRCSCSSTLGPLDRALAKESQRPWFKLLVQHRAMASGGFAPHWGCQKGKN